MFMARSRPSLCGPHRDKRWIWNMAMSDDDDDDDDDGYDDDG